MSIEINTAITPWIIGLVTASATLAGCYQATTNGTQDNTMQTSYQVETDQQSTKTQDEIQGGSDLEENESVIPDNLAGNWAVETFGFNGVAYPVLYEEFTDDMKLSLLKCEFSIDEAGNVTLRKCLPDGEPTTVSLKAEYVDDVLYFYEEGSSDACLYLTLTPNNNLQYVSGSDYHNMVLNFAKAKRVSDYIGSYTVTSCYIENWDLWIYPKEDFTQAYSVLGEEISSLVETIRDELNTMSLDLREDNTFTFVNALGDESEGTWTKYGFSESIYFHGKSDGSDGEDTADVNLVQTVPYDYKKDALTLTESSDESTMIYYFSKAEN